jgi:putative oxygen-independent coproporphyrinogen III oxidase
MKEIPLYIHIPFCRSKCSYCAFYSCINHTVKDEKNFLCELKKQISSYMELTESDLCNTIYIGGGTPSLISNENLSDLFHFLHQYISPEIEEFTIECNPEDVNFELIELLNRSDVNRISLGVQSFQDDVLKASGRKTDSKTVDKAIRCINENWKGRFSIDIISGLPGQTIEGQRGDIQKAIMSGVDHISCYSLIIEEKTPIADNPDLLPDQEDEDLMWDICRKKLLNNGFNHYEVSNFSKKGFESRHNLHYWKMNEYIGCGPGAVSMIYDDGIKRLSNPHDLNAYQKGFLSNWSVKEEIIEDLDFIFENYMMGLRTMKGIDRSTFLNRFNVYPEELIKETISSSEHDTFIITEEFLSLSDESRLFLNSLLMKISDELESLKIDFTVNWP